MQLKWTCLSVKCFHTSHSIKAGLMWAAPGERQGGRLSAGERGRGPQSGSGRKEWEWSHSSLGTPSCHREDREHDSLGMGFCTYYTELHVNVRKTWTVTHNARELNMVGAFLVWRMVDVAPHTRNRANNRFTYTYNIAGNCTRKMMIDLISEWLKCFGSYTLWRLKSKWAVMEIEGEWKPLLY